MDKTTGFKATPPYLEFKEEEVNNLLEYLVDSPYKFSAPIVSMLESKIRAKKAKDAEEQEKFELGLKKRREVEYNELSNKAHLYDLIMEQKAQEEEVVVDNSDNLDGRV